MLSLQKELSALKQKISALEIEQIHYQKYVEEFDIQEIPEEISKIKSWEKALELSLIFESEAEELSKRNPIIEIIKRIIEFLRIKKFNRTIAQELLNKYSKDYLIAISQQKFYEIQINELSKSLKSISKELDSYNFKKKR